MGRTFITLVAVIFLASCLVVFVFLNSSLWDQLLGYYDVVTDREFMAENKVFLRPWMVRDIRDHHQLLGRRAPVPAPLVRPPVADHPDQR